MNQRQRCPLCGGLVKPDQEVERVVRERDDVAIVRVRADVCADCGEALLHPGMADRIVAAKAALRRGIQAGAVVGRVFDLRASIQPS
ncbi:MAG: YgiT-type zinc finger protein [Planctomycetes bacterium]|nr:YgiT-type zinc finger protein [Planctomycetota bacterium]